MVEPMVEPLVAMMERQWVDLKVNQWVGLMAETMENWTVERTV